MGRGIREQHTDSNHLYYLILCHTEEAAAQCLDAWVWLVTKADNRVYLQSVQKFWVELVVA